MRLIMRKKAHQRLLRINRLLEKEIRCRGRMRFGRTLAALNEMEEQMIRRCFWEERGRGRA